LAILPGFCDFYQRQTFYFRKLLLSPITTTISPNITNLNLRTVKLSLLCSLLKNAFYVNYEIITFPQKKEIRILAA
jgi:hypothetical protein